MEGLFYLIVGIVIVAVSVINQKKRRQALAAEAQRRRESRPQVSGQGPQAQDEDETGDGEGQADLQQTLGEILRQLGATPQADQAAQAAPGAPAAAALRQHAQPPRSRTVRRTPMDGQYRKSLIPEGETGEIGAPDTWKKTAARKAPVIREDHSGEEHTGPWRPREAARKESLIREETVVRSGGQVSDRQDWAFVSPGAPPFAARFARARREQIRDGMVWAEILGKPLALRDE